LSKPLGPKEYLKVTNLFSEEVRKTLHNVFKYPHGKEVQEIYGRMKYFAPYLKPKLFIKTLELDVLNTVNTLLNENFLEAKAVLSVEYSLAYGKPDLPPHFDGDDTDLIVNYQFDSNTDWPLGVNGELIELESNSGVLFNPNSNLHWRPLKTFKEGEYVKMIFFRFRNPVTPSDYSHLRLTQEDPIFDEARKARGTLY
jgi:hypothetical protein